MFETGRNIFLALIAISVPVSVTDFFLGAESQRIFGGFGEYAFHPEADHKFKKDVKDDQIVVMRLPSNDELETWSRKFREMFK